MTGDWVIRRYEDRDLEDCRRIFRSNCPRYFAADEERYLDRFVSEQGYGHPDDEYFYVLEEGGRLLACAGFYVVPSERRANLVWGMVHADRHGSGMGTRLMDHRIAIICRLPGVDRITMDTTQHCVEFFKRFGFREVGVRPDHYGPGLDRHDLVLPLKAAAGE